MKENPRYNRANEKIISIAGIQRQNAINYARRAEDEIQKQVEITRPVIDEMRKMKPDDLTDICKAVQISMEYIIKEGEHSYFGDSNKLGNLIGATFVFNVRKNR